MSHHSAYGYYVTQDQLALDLYISRRSVQRALDSLCKAGLIGYNELYRTGREANGMKSPRSYFAVQEKINAAIEATMPCPPRGAGKSSISTFNKAQVRLMRQLVTSRL